MRKKTLLVGAIVAALFLGLDFGYQGIKSKLRRDEERFKAEMRRSIEEEGKRIVAERRQGYKWKLEDISEGLDYRIFVPIKDTYGESGIGNKIFCRIRRQRDLAEQESPIEITYYSDYGKDDLVLALKSGEYMPRTDRKILLESLKHAKQPEIREETKEQLEFIPPGNREFLLSIMEREGYGGDPVSGRMYRSSPPSSGSVPFVYPPLVSSGFSDRRSYFEAKAVIDEELGRIITGIIEGERAASEFGGMDSVFDVNPLRVKSREEAERDDFFKTYRRAHDGSSYWLTH